MTGAALRRPGADVEQRDVPENSAEICDYMPANRIDRYPHRSRPIWVGERIFAAPDNPVTLARSRRWWGDNLTSVSAGTSASIPLTGPIQASLSQECPQAFQTNVCLEFGTYPMEEVVLAMRAEHWLHRYGCLDDESRQGSIKAALKRAFYPQYDDWKLAVWIQGREVYLQSLNGLRRVVANRPPSSPFRSRRVPRHQRRPRHDHLQCA